MASVQPFLLAGRWTTSPETQVIRSPWDDRAVAEVSLANAAHVEEALTTAQLARTRLRAQSTSKRRAVLTKLSQLVTQHADELAQLIVNEVAKPISAARLEVSRAAHVLELTAGELLSFGHESCVVDTANGFANTSAEVMRVPAGVVLGIVPFNFPFNLGVHKVAPALGVGAPIVVKPPPQSPSPLLLLGKLALEAGADEAALQVLPCDNATAERMAMDPRVAVVSFTGSAAVGWKLKQKCPGKVLLELGGNAAAIVCADTALEDSVTKLVTGSFFYSGQVCIKSQRIFVEAPAFDRFAAEFVKRVATLEVEPPEQRTAFLSALIDESASNRLETWTAEAKARGATVLFEGTRVGRKCKPAVFSQVPKDCRLVSQEVFAPAVVIEPVADFDEAIARTNDSVYGLQAGVFTNDIRRIRQAFASLEVGGVIVNDAPIFRSDAMPYGGVKQSGVGREGPRYAMRELTEERLLVIRP